MFLPISISFLLCSFSFFSMYLCIYFFTSFSLSLPCFSIYCSLFFSLFLLFLSPIFFLLFPSPVLSTSRLLYDLNRIQTISLPFSVPSVFSPYFPFYLSLSLLFSFFNLSWRLFYFCLLKKKKTCQYPFFFAWQTKKKREQKCRINCLWQYRWGWDRRGLGEHIVCFCAFVSGCVRV